VEAALPGVERHRADFEPAAKLGDAQAAFLLTLNLAAPPLLPRPAICQRSESEYGLSPGDDKLGSGMEATMRAKAGWAGRLP
jgi:hypothetical protein